MDPAPPWRRLRFRLAAGPVPGGGEEVHVDRPLGGDHVRELLDAGEPARGPLRRHAVLLAVEVLDARPDAERAPAAIGARRKVDHRALDALGLVIVARPAADREPAFG